jgi:hypothetical protein
VEELVDSGPVRGAAPRERAGSSPAWQAEDEIINLENKKCILSSVGRALLLHSKCRKFESCRVYKSLRSFEQAHKNKCPSDGTGRHLGLRNQGPKGRASSSLAWGTTRFAY